MKGFFICSIVALLLVSSVVTAEEPVLKVTFEGYVTGNDLTCKRQHMSCPSANHFGGPWGKNSMIGKPMLDRVTGEILIAYNRGPVTFVSSNGHQNYAINPVRHGSLNIVSGRISVGGTIINLDRDWIGGSLRPRTYLDTFSMFDRRSWQRAGFSFYNSTHSGHEFYGYRDDKRLLLKKFFAQTDFNLKLEFFELPTGDYYFGEFSEDSLPGFEWFGPGKERDINHSNIRLYDFERRYSEELGHIQVGYTTTIDFAITWIKVESLNITMPGPNPEPNPDPEGPGRPPAPPQSLDVDAG